MLAARRMTIVLHCEGIGLPLIIYRMPRATDSASEGLAFSSAGSSWSDCAGGTALLQQLAERLEHSGDLCVIC